MLVKLQTPQGVSSDLDPQFSFGKMRAGTAFSVCHLCWIEPSVSNLSHTTWDFFKVSFQSLHLSKDVVISVVLYMWRLRPWRLCILPKVIRQAKNKARNKPRALLSCCTSHPLACSCQSDFLQLLSFSSLAPGILYNTNLDLSSSGDTC